ncbi:MAG: NUDIX hydrolase, partial [Sphingosinicella sp.]|uniref:NUDIX hydrolase n=1 Tax=Sphingosinicella sp. TaxID=1917971 RepID=UPI0040379E40
PAVRPAPAPAEDLRERLTRGEAFPQALEAHGLALEFEALTPFARWCPNFRETRRFDTLFYLAAAPEGAPEPIVAEHEAVRAFWASAAEILAELEAGRAHAIFPTRRNLERLARFASIEEARADAARHPVTKIVPWVETRDGAPHVCIPDEIGYPVTSEPLETARRR